MNIDYKLVMILILSIILLYLYNKIEILRADIITNKRMNDNHIELVNNNINKVSYDFYNHKESVEKNVKNNNVAKVNDVINIESLNVSENQEVLSYDKKQENNVVELQENDEIELKENDEIEFEDNNLATYSNNEVQSIENDYNINQDDNDLNLELNVSDMVNEIVDDSANIVVMETVTTDIYNKPSDSLLEVSSNNIIDVSSSNSLENKDDNIEINDEVVNHEENNNIEEDNEQNDNFNVLNNKDLKSIKLPELQTIAEKYNIETTKNVNGKTKNKTKQELYTEITQNNN